MNNEFFLRNIISSCGFHLDCIIAVAELSQAKTTQHTEVINFIEKIFVTVCVKRKNGAAEQIELNCELYTKRAINHSDKLVSGIDVMWISSEILD